MVEVFQLVGLIAALAIKTAGGLVIGLGDNAGMVEAAPAVPVLRGGYQSLA
jgi:hypothetical protein